MGKNRQHHLRVPVSLDSELLSSELEESGCPQLCSSLGIGVTDVLTVSWQGPCVCATVAASLDGILLTVWGTASAEQDDKISLYVRKKSLWKNSLVVSI